MNVISPREKRKIYMESKGYGNASAKEREARVTSGLRALKALSQTLTPDAREFLRRGEDGGPYNE